MRRIRTTLPSGRPGRIRPHVLRRDGILQAPTETPPRSRYEMALAAGWRPLA